VTDAACPSPGRRSRAKAKRQADRVEAFAFWASLPDDQRTYRAVAEKYAVTVSAVKKWSAEEGWVGKLESIRDEAEQAARKVLVKSWEERVDDQVRLTQKARAQLEASIDSGDYQVTGRDVASLARIEALFMGKPTDRLEHEFIARADVDVRVRWLIDLSFKFIPTAEARAAFLDELERELLLPGDNETREELG
jgi:hypothetical protein